MAHIVGTAKNDTLNGTAGDDQIEGLAGSDTLYGLGGNDRLDGGPGADAMYGGPGNDTYLVDNPGDAVGDGSIALVSTDDPLPNGFSAPAVSGDGRYVAFWSGAPELVPGDTNSTWDVFVKDLQTRAITRVSTAADGTQANSGAPGSGLAISADGRYVAFASDATNLVPGDTNGWTDVFVKDVWTGAITRASIAPNGMQGDWYSHSPAISGHYVAFESGATTLVPWNGSFSDILVKDLWTGTITRASSAADGTEGNSFSHNPSISADGRYVAFDSDSTNLVPGDTNGLDDVFVKDMVTAVIKRASTEADGTQTSEWESSGPSISADGRYVAFEGDATIVRSPNDPIAGIFVKDLWTGAITLASSTADGTAGIGLVASPGISADGRHVAFWSNALNLPGYENADGAVFVKDLQTEAITPVEGGIPLFSVDGRLLIANGEGIFVASVAFGGGVGGGSDGVYSSISYRLVANIENLTLTGTEAINGTGNASHNVLTGNASNNVLTGGAGYDTLDGGGGFDTAVFSGAVASYQFIGSGAQVTISGPDGIDTLTNIEQLNFANVAFSIADRSHFDPLHYLNSNPDVAAAAVDPLTHYWSTGWAEGRDPNPRVDLAAVNWNTSPPTAI